MLLHNFFLLQFFILRQSIFISQHCFSVSSLISLFMCHNRVLNVVKFFFLPFALFFVTTELSGIATFFLPSFLSFFAIFISMSQQHSSASSGALLMQCCDKVMKCHDNLSPFILPFCCDIYFCVAPFFFFVFLLILIRDRVVKCCDILSTVILHSALSLLRHSSACCDKILQFALGFCRDIAVIMLQYFSFSCLSHFC